MAKSFNLTAQLNLQGPGNLKPVIGKLKRELSTISGGVDLKINKSSVGSIKRAAVEMKALSDSLTRAAKDSKTLNTNLSALNSTINKTASVAKSASASSNAVATGMNKVTTATNKANQSFAQHINALIKTKDVQKSMAFSLVYRGLNLITNGVTETTQHIIDFNKELNRLKQVDPTANLSGISKEIRSLAVNLGVSSKLLAETTVTLAQAGYSAKEASDSLDILAKTSLSATFGSIQQTTEGLIAMKNQFGFLAKEGVAALDSINQLSKLYAVESEDLIAAVQRTGGVFAESSRQLDTPIEKLQKFGAIFTSIRQTTRQSAETIATGIKTIAGRLQRASTYTFFKDMGVEIRDARGEFKGFYEVIGLISEAMKKQGIAAGSLQYAKIVEELGGIRQIGNVIPLLNQFALAQEALNKAQNSSGSVAGDAATAQETFATSIQKSVEAMFDLGQAISDSGIGFLAKTLIDITTVGLKVAKVFAPLAPIFAGKLALKAFGGGGGGGGLLGGLFGGGGGPTPSDNTPTIQNTSAVQKQTDATNKLIDAMGRFQANASAEGFPHFARGGVVPGSGNSDSVHAMLTPGEFVIRKDAVKALGTERLHKMNKYATGGKILEPANHTVGAMLLEDKSSDYDIPAADVAKSKIDKERRPAVRAALDAEGVSNYKVIRTGPKNGSALFTRTIDNALKNAVNQSAESLANMYGVSAPDIDSLNVGNFIKTVNDGARGAVFEGVLQHIAKQGVYSDDEGNKNAPFDFENGIGSQLQTENLYPSLNMNFIDAKATSAAAAKAEISKKIANEIYESIDPSKYLGIAEQKAQSSGDPDTYEKLKNFIAARPKKNVYKYTDFQNVKAGFSSKTNKGEIESFLDANFDRLGLQAKDDREYYYKKGYQRRAKGGFIQKFADGGEVASPKQIAFIESLFSQFERGVGARHPRINEWMPPDDKRQASDIISKLKATIPEIPLIKQFLGKGINYGGGMGSGFVVTKFPPIGRVQQRPLSQFGGNIEQIQEYIKRGELSFGSSVQQKRGLSQGSMALRTRRRFAEGGSAEDTVPALLTPGEFVINKEAASRIGSANLNKLNHADKIQGFNKGGAVGNIVQSFADGGNVEPIIRAISENLGRSMQMISQQLSAIMRQDLKDIQSSGGSINDVFKGIIERLIIELKESGGTTKENNKLISELTGSILNIKMLGPKGSNLPDATAEKIAKDIQKTLKDIATNGPKGISESSALAKDIASTKAPIIPIGSFKTLPSDFKQDFKAIYSGIKTGLTTAFEKVSGAMGPTISKIKQTFDSPLKASLAGATALKGAFVALDGTINNIIGDSEGLAAAFRGAEGAVTGFMQGASAAKGLGLSGPQSIFAGVALAIGSALREGLKAYKDKQLENTIKDVSKAGDDFTKALQRLSKEINKNNLDEFNDTLKAGGASLEAQQKLMEIGIGNNRIGGMEQTGGALGGAAAGGAIGAAIGSFIPVIGTAIGGVVGAIAGAITGFQMVSDSIERQNKAAGEYAVAGDRLFQQFTELSRIRLDRMGIQELKQLQSQGKTGAAIFDTYAQALEKTGNYTKEQAQNLAVEQAALAAYAAKRKDEGASEAQIVKELTDERAASIEVGKELVKVNADALLSETLLLKERKQVEITTRNLITTFQDFGEQLRRNTAEFNDASRAREMSSANTLGERTRATFSTQISDILDNIGAYSQADVRRAGLSAGTPVYGRAQTEEFLKYAQANKILESRLPELLKNAGRDAGARQQVVSTVEGMLQNLGIDPGETEATMKQIQQVLDKNADADTATLLEELGPVIENISSVGKEAMDRLKEAANRMNLALEGASDAAYKFYDAMSKAREYTIKGTQIRYQAEIDLRKTLGQDIDLETLNAGFNAQVNALLDPMRDRGVDVSQDPESILRGMQDLNAAQLGLIEDIERNRRGLSVEDPANREFYTQSMFESVDAFAANNDALAESKKALELLANDGTRAANALSKIQEREQRNRAGANFLREIFTNDPAQNIQLRGQLEALGRARAGDQNILQNPQMLEQAFGGLDKIGGMLDPKLRAQIEGDLLENTLKAQGINLNDVFMPGVNGQPDTTYQDIVNSVRGKGDPNDPLIQAYYDAVNTQIAANDMLSALQIAEAKIQEQRLKDIHQGILELPERLATEIQAANELTADELKAGGAQQFEDAQLKANLEEAKQQQTESYNDYLEKRKKAEELKRMGATANPEYQTAVREKLDAEAKLRADTEKTQQAQAAVDADKRAAQAEYDRKLKQAEDNDKRRAQEREDDAQAERERQRKNLEIRQQEINKSNERTKATREAQAAQASALSRGGVVYASNGAMVPRGTDTVPAMLSPGEFVMSRYAVKKHGVGMMNYLNNGGKPIEGSATVQLAGPSATAGEGISILGSALGSNGNPLTLRNAGSLVDQTFGLDGYGAAAGDLADAAVAGVVEGRKAASVGAGMQGGLAAYGGLYLTDLARQGVEYALDPEKKVEQIYQQNRKQATQGYAQNVGENLANPGRATAQLAQESVGLASDVSTAQAAADKTRRMEFNRNVEKRIANRDNINRQLGMFPNPLVQYQARGGLVNYLADGGQPTLNRKSVEDQVVAEARRVGIMEENETIDAFLQRTRTPEYSIMADVITGYGTDSEKTERQYVGGDLNMAALTRAQLLKIRRVSRLSERLGIGLLDAQTLDNTRNKDPKFYNNSYDSEKVTGQGHTEEQVAEMQEKRKEILAGIRERRTHERRTKKGTGNAAYDQMMAGRAAAYNNMMAQRRAAHQARYKASGGAIYANNGMFTPKGTDTVPAMLTPGEFVINKASTEKYRGIIERINNDTLYRAAGGGTPGVAGGTGGGMTSLSIDFSTFEQNTNLFNGSVGSFGEFVSSFGTYVTTLQNFNFPTLPDRIELYTNGRIVHEVRGAAAFEAMEVRLNETIEEQSNAILNLIYNQSNGTLGKSNGGS